MSSSKRKVLNLALQGGGAHGAFTWGALERLLDAPDIEIGRISGTSAGAFNGGALATGYARAGREGAKRHLRRLWTSVASVGLPWTFALAPLRKPGMGIWDDALPLTSPYQANPLGMAPLRAALQSVIDIDALRSARAPQLFVNAVNVRTAQIRIFGPDAMSLEAFLASACAPFMFQAVQIDQEIYWDGSYGANPMLAPLYEEAPHDADIFMIELTPVRREETPRTAKNILNRINEIVSVRGLVSELGAVDLLNRSVPGASIRVHVLSLPEHGDPLHLEPSIKRTVGVELFESLHAAGYEACDRWLAAHAHRIGAEATTDLRTKYLTTDFGTGEGDALAQA